MDEKTAAVIGAGNGGFAMAADLELNGWDINLFELPRFEENILPLLEKGGIEITGAANTGFARMARITSDIEEAVEDASVIMVNTLALAHEEIAEIMAPIIREGHTIFILPGNGGSLVFTKVLKEKGIKIKVQFAETLSLPYGCRKKNPTTINVSRLLGINMLAALPSKDNQAVLEIFKRFYPNSISMTNVLEVAISNPNIILHPSATMLNMARIEFSKGDFGLYQEGFTPSVMKVLDALNEELMNIKAALGLPDISFKELFERRYEKTFEEQFGLMRRIGSKGPFDVKTRYITEDVPVGMVLIASIGRLLGVPTPTYDATIHLCGLMNDIDYWSEGDEP